MKLQILSYLHIEFGIFELPKTNADVIILAGDTCTGKIGIAWLKINPRGVPIIYIHGNHEYYREAWPKLVESNKAFCAGTNYSLNPQHNLYFNDY